MLKRLELVGFKSFADKTHFDFTGGITAIVGPNGSGKSNIVDAVRWILGEQSAKSLRGGEMADVIFNGSTSRRSFGLAEVTMTFDNSRRSLAADAAEVQITRRVYRSGEGEYLINQQPCRLKDIKDLFLGSGAGSDAYSIIEQGRVDVLLQSSTKERRTIFEEAAGISRFKAKKTETMRKLERVDHNLQRLRDILEEVDKQLRALKLQAAKAQRFQEYSTRLQELRIALGLEEYHNYSERLGGVLAVLEGLRASLAERSAQSEAWEADAHRLEEALSRLDEAIHQQERLLADARQHIAAEQTLFDNECNQSGKLETTLKQAQTRLSDLNAKVAALATAASQATAELQGVEAHCQDQRQRVQTLQAELKAASERLLELQRQTQADHAERVEQVRKATHLQNDVLTHKARCDELRRQRESLLRKSERAAETLATIDLELQELTQADESLQARLGAARQSQAETRQQRDQMRQLRDDTNQVVSDLRAQRSGVANRIDVLDKLERSHEGLGSGVREVVGLLEQPDPGPWRAVLGMTVDVLTVRREHAPLIDLALGERSQYFLVRDGTALAEALQQRRQPFSGRVSFLLLSSLRHAVSKHAPTGVRPVSVPSRSTDLASTTGVLASAEQLVTCEHPELADLPMQLLGNTLIVRDLIAARALAAQAAAINTNGRPFRFVTLQGELLEADGTLTVGTHHAETGILSRKSELRELRQQVSALDRRIVETERDLADLRDRLTNLDARNDELKEEIERLTEQAADLRNRISQYRQRREGLHEEVTLSTGEITGIETEMQQRDAAWQRARIDAEAAEKQVHALQARLVKADQESREREQQRQQRQQEVTGATAALAQTEERLTALKAKQRQIEADLAQRQQERREEEQRRREAQAGMQEGTSKMLRASAALASLYLQKETAQRQAAELGVERALQRQERQMLNERTQTVRGERQTQQEQAHAREMEAKDLQHRREHVAERLREDYQLDLATLYQAKLQGPVSPVQSLEAPVEGAETIQIAPPPLDLGLGVLNWKEANDEIAELKRKISKLGSVNLESLQELADTEKRAEALQAQFDDLTSAKRVLEEIIAKINTDSRRLFQEIFTTIRTHFQELFRKLFGGGTADIVLEDETDILESGIEIIARPPGKELRSISLMSGGEKTMTVVALLLAIFRSKPSPFCILDEVDAALDEANVSRYTAVLRDFLDQSQFIIITHSKRTMASADVIYGITMQESGVSKRVAVRFEDWPDDDQLPVAEPVAATAQNGN